MTEAADNKAEAGHGSYGICRVINAPLSPLTDLGHSKEK